MGVFIKSVKLRDSFRDITGQFFANCFWSFPGRSSLELIPAWHKDLQTMGLFDVITQDSDTLTIATQYLDGEVSQYALYE